MFLIRWLGNLAQNPNRCLTWFLTGSGLFFTGLAFLVLLENSYDSLQRELMALLALALVGLGVIVASVGYLSLTYYRWYQFFKK